MVWRERRALHLRVNDKLCEITGYRREELLGMTFMDLTLPEELAEGLERARALAAGEISSYSVQKRFRRKTGEIVWINLVSNLVRTAAGTPQYFNSVTEDITPRKIAEFRLHRLNRLHTVLSKTGDSVVRARDRKELYETVCRIVVEDGLLRAAFIAERRRGGHGRRPPGARDWNICAAGSSPSKTAR